jgi:hypothetical protein
MSLNILSIQSWVAYWHVGNASAMFPLQRLGAEVWGCIRCNSPTTPAMAPGAALGIGRNDSPASRAGSRQQISFDVVF